MKEVPLSLKGPVSGSTPDGRATFFLYGFSWADGLLWECPGASGWFPGHQSTITGGLFKEYTIPKGIAFSLALRLFFKKILLLQIGLGSLLRCQVAEGGD